VGVAVGASVGAAVGTSVVAMVGAFVGAEDGIGVDAHCCLKLASPAKPAWLMWADDCGKPPGQSHSQSSPAIGMHMTSSPAPVFSQQ
jgi:hypothetical protein